MNLESVVEALIATMNVASRKIQFKGIRFMVLIGLSFGFAGVGTAYAVSLIKPLGFSGMSSLSHGE